MCFFFSLMWKMQDRIDDVTVEYVFFQFHKLCAHRLYAVLFISVTFNKIMAMEEIKLTQNIHNESLGADVSGMVQRGYSQLQIKETEAIFSLLFSVQNT